MSTKRGRIQITGFDPDRIEDRDPLSDWSEQTDTTSSSRWQRTVTKFKRNRSAVFALGVVLVLAVMSLLARPISISVFGELVTVQPISLAPYDPTAKLQTLTLDHEVDKYDPPSVDHPMGIDGGGRDIFSRFLAGGRYSMSIGVIVVSITSIVGVIYGGIAGYFGGIVDEVLMRILDVIYAFPGIVVALVLLAVLGSGYWTLVLAFSLFGWAGYARLVRGEILSVKENEYVLAAKALGGRDTTILFRHVIPNAIAPVIVQASLAIGTTVIGVAALGFLGLGFPSGTPEWGTMLNNARSTISPGPGAPIKWWVTFFPGAAIFVFVMSMNMIGDGINDALDAQQDIAGGEN